MTPGTRVDGQVAKHKMGRRSNWIAILDTAALHCKHVVGSRRHVSNTDARALVVLRRRATARASSATVTTGGAELPTIVATTVFISIHCSRLATIEARTSPTTRVLR